MSTTTALLDDVIVVEHNVNEFFSDHYLRSIFDDDVKQLAKEWKAREKDGEQTFVSELLRLADVWDDLASDEPEDETVPDRNDAFLAALDYHVDRRAIDAELHGLAAQIPVAATVEVGGSIEIVVLEGRDARTIDEAFDAEDDSGELLNPITTSKDPIVHNRNAIDAIYAQESPPRFVLLATGNLLIITERAKWIENRYFAVAVADLLNPGTRRAPERRLVERFAALAARSSLAPDSGDAFFDQITLSAHRHATEISDDLRDAVRDSVELLANEVIAQRKARNLVQLPAGDADELKRQSLRVLYRLIFLLFAEARPSMGLLPSRDPRYTDGYGLDRLRDLADTELVSEKARAGTHLHESIWKLFDLITSEQSEGDIMMNAVDSLQIDRLDSDLFLEDKTSMFKGIKLSNGVWQDVLQKLTLSKAQRGRQRSYLSYAGLGINQLGAVYERIMSYTGHFCSHDMYEVAKGGNNAAGDARYLVRTDRAEDYPESVFITARSADDLDDIRVRHPKGSFVLRLSGRDRQQSASFYTPEVLTECVVRHGLVNLLEQKQYETADSLLEITICEPAMGSGAFLNEAINQLATKYLERKQAEPDAEPLDHEQYRAELQKVKAHFALHQAYGVDLNSSAVELAEVSLWLNCMTPELGAPWFGLHLRSGNSLIGARREVYAPDDITSRRYLKEAPTSLAVEKNLPAGHVHHFLLPAEGWASAAKHADSKKVAADDCRRLAKWHSDVKKKLTVAQLRRAQRLAERVEEHWQQAIEILREAERELKRPIHLYGQKTPEGGGRYKRREIEAVLKDSESSLSRLRAVMNLWCELWFLTPIADGSDDAPVEPPTIEEWFDVLESILGDGPVVQRQFDFDWLIQQHADDRERGAEGQLVTLGDLEVSWFVSGDRVYEPGRYFHWQLEFGHLFTRNGGFDLQVGNPPWVRPSWDIALTLADLDPFHIVVSDGKAEQVVNRAPETLSRFPSSAAHYCRELAYVNAVAKFLGSEVTYPLLTGLATNTYTNFVNLTWSNSTSEGVQALLHQMTHLLAPEGRVFRAESYGRLRRLWHFTNVAKMFPLTDRLQYVCAVYGENRGSENTFDYATQLHIVPTLEGSLAHDGRGEVPSVQFEDGSGHDRRPHADRIMRVGEPALRSMALVMDETDTPPLHARLMRPYLRGDLSVIEKLGRGGPRIGDLAYEISRGWEEDKAKKDGTIRSEIAVPQSWEDTILQGPHFAVGTPFAKLPRLVVRSNNDWDPVELSTIDDDFIPRTCFQRECGRDEYLARQRQHWGEPESSYLRLIYRRRISSVMYRTVHAGILPKGAMHPNATMSVAFKETQDLMMTLGVMASLPIDGLVKLAGMEDLYESLLSELPFPESEELREEIIKRASRLYLVTSGLRHEANATDLIPVLDAFGRRELMVELDALVAIGLGLNIEELITLYRSQFPVLRKYEYAMRFDAKGRQVPNDVLKGFAKDPTGADFQGYELIDGRFRQVHREAEMRANYERFADEFGRPSV